MEILEFLLNISRFPSLQLWKTSGIYYAECSPSFRQINSSGKDLEDCLLDLIDQLMDYFDEDEIQELKRLGVDI